MQKRIIAIIFIFSILISPVFAETKFEVDISKGLVPGHIAVFDVGHNEDVGTTEMDVWTGPTNSIPWLTVATRLNVTSSDVDDTVAGAGARYISIEGLDENYTRINETLAMNGQNNATTANAYLRINVISVVEMGTDGGSNEGDIYIGEGPIVAGVQAITYDFIDAGYGRSMVSSWTIPANYTLYLTSTLYTSHTGATGKRVEMYLNIRVLSPSGTRTRWRVFEIHAASSEFDRPFGPPAPIPEKTDIFFSAEVDTGSAAVSTDFTGFIVRDGFNAYNETVEIQEPLDVNIVESIDLMSTEFFVFILIAVATMYIAWFRTPNKRNAGLGFAFSALFWIATMYQWAVDHVGTQEFGMMWLFIAPLSFCFVMFTEKSWGQVDDATETIAKGKSGL